MQNFQEIFETRQQSFVSAFSICMTVPLRSHFLSVCNKMTVNQHINHETVKKYVTCIIAFFISLSCVTFSQFYSITSLVLFTENNKLWNERKEGFLYI